jgi:hypothetical protein
MSNISFGLFILDEVKNTFLWLVLGLPAYYVFMLLIEWGGSAFYILLLIFTIGITVIWRYLHTNIIA